MLYQVQKLISGCPNVEPTVSQPAFHDTADSCGNKQSHRFRCDIASDFPCVDPELDVSDQERKRLVAQFHRLGRQCPRNPDRRPDHGDQY